MRKSLGKPSVSLPSNIQGDCLTKFWVIFTENSRKQTKFLHELELGAVSTEKTLRDFNIKSC